MLAIIYAEINGRRKSVTVDTCDPVDACRKWEQLLGMIRGEEPARVERGPVVQGTKAGKLERNRRRIS
jgi:hypothetical protein